MGKKIEEIKFNPADYDYMDSMPLEGWIWEIIRRTEGYKQEYEKIEKAVMNSSKEIDEVVKHFMKEVEKMCLHIRSDVKEPNPNYYLKVKRGSLNTYIPKPQAKYIDVEEAIRIKGISPVEVALYEEYVSDEWRFKEVIHLPDGDFEICEEHPGVFLVNDLAVPTPEDTIYVGISRKAKIKDIEECLFPILREYLEPHKPKIRDEKWKYYLIVYDLKEKYQDISYEDISISFMNAYPYLKEVVIIKKGKKFQKEVESSYYFSEKNCINFYKSSLALIKGEYKKYLYA